MSHNSCQRFTLVALDQELTFVRLCGGAPLAVIRLRKQHDARLAERWDVAEQRQEISHVQFRQIEINEEHVVLTFENVTGYVCRARAGIHGVPFSTQSLGSGVEVRLVAVCDE